MGFVVASKPFHALIDHPEFELQIVPSLCGLGLIPLAGWLATHLSGRREVGLLAAVLVLLHPQSGLFAVRVKQFIWDAALMLTVLGIGLPSLDPTRLPPPRSWRSSRSTRSPSFCIWGAFRTRRRIGFCSIGRGTRGSRRWPGSTSLGFRWRPRAPMDSGFPWAGADSRR